MRKRTLLTIVFIGLMLMISVLVLLVVLLVRGNNDGGGTELAAPVEAKDPPIIDPYAGREGDAVSRVQQHKVLDPAYVAEVLALRERNAAEEADSRLRRDRLDKEEDAREAAEKKGEPFVEPPQTEADIEPRYVTIAELVDAEHLENQFGMSFLERGDWRALHLETDIRNKEEGQLEINDDPFYEVYLEYKDGEVVIGPVWVVNIQSGQIVPRNEMAEFFEFGPDSGERAKELLTRPERVVSAITNHKFESGIELGGVLLLHFVGAREESGGKPAEGAKKKKTDAKDRIIGWTVGHDFRDTYNAYFQWIEGGEPKVAQFRFDWSEQRLEPRGLNAIDLMVEGEERKAVPAVSIWPETYTNDPNIPRDARWPADHPCRDKANAALCNSFAAVLEQDDFIESVQWLLTRDPDAAELFAKCRADRKCRWNPYPDGDRVVVEYVYVIEGTERKFSFKVDPKEGTIEPVDDITRWAFFSVTPRT